MDIDSVLKAHGIGVGGSILKSIQSGTLTMAVGTSSQNVTLTPVDLTKAIVLFTNEADTTGSGASRAAVLGELSSAAQLHFERYDGSLYSTTISWFVIEFTNVKSIQRGRSVGNASVTVSSVNIGKALPSLTGLTYNTASPDLSVHQSLTRVYLSNSTTLNFYSYPGTSNIAGITRAWQLIEFN